MGDSDLTCLDLYSEVRELWKIENLDTASLFRHLTEVNGKEARGGYLEGSLWFSKDLCSCPFVLKMTLISSENLTRSNNLDHNVGQMRIHPNLLYITRFDMNCMKAGKPKRLREKEPKNPLWRIELRIKDGSVDWWTEDTAQPGGYYQEICQLKSRDDGFILDLKELHITVITPLQRTNVNGIKIKDAIRFRKEMFNELEDDRWDKIAREMEKFYTKTDGKPELDRICLSFDIHAMDGVRELPAMKDQTRISNQILNTKSKLCGAFDLTGEISKQKTCTRVQRKIHIFSKFQLPISSSPELEIQPRFVLKRRGATDYICDSRTYEPYSELIQPEVNQTKVEKMWISFNTPRQKDDVIKRFKQDAIDIYIEGYRLKDKDSTDTKILFQYNYHDNVQEFCLFCYEHPDTLSSGEQDTPDHEKARPGVKRRQKTQGRKSRFASSSSTGSVSNTCSPDIKDLMEDSSADPSPSKSMRYICTGEEKGGDITQRPVSSFDNVDGSFDMSSPEQQDSHSPVPSADVPPEIGFPNLPDLGGIINPGDLETPSNIDWNRVQMDGVGLIDKKQSLSYDSSKPDKQKPSVSTSGRMSSQEWTLWSEKRHGKHSLLPERLQQPMPDILPKKQTNVCIPDFVQKPVAEPGYKKLRNFVMPVVLIGVGIVLSSESTIAYLESFFG